MSNRKAKIKLKWIAWIFLFIGITIPLIVLANSNQTETNTNKDFAEVVYKELTYKPEKLQPFPVGTPTCTTCVIKTQSSASSTRELKKLEQSTVALSDNETAVWNFLIQRYTRNQTAGIMGNLQQEHNFQTSGDGLAQWNGGRKARLMSMSNPYSLTTQLNFLVMEINESRMTIPDEVVSATVVFQNQFERCGICNEIARINYATAILGKH